MGQPLRTLNVTMKLDAKKYKDGIEQTTQVTRRFSVDSQKSLEQVAKEHAHLGRVVSVTEDNSKQLRAEQKRATREMRSQEGAFDSLNNKISQHNRLTSLGITDQNDLAAAMRLGTKATDDQIQKYVELNRQYRNLSVSGKHASNDMKAFRGNMQNVGYQVQDFAVQVGGGTSAMVAMGQQLPQLLSGFGLMGVMAGTAAALAVPLASAIFAIGKESKKATEHIDELGGDIEKLTQAQREWAAVTAATEMSGLSKSLSVAEAEAERLQNRLDTLNGGASFHMWKSIESQIEETTLAMKKQNAEVDTLKQKKKVLEDLQESLRTGVDVVRVRTEAEESFADALEASKKAAADQIDTFATHMNQLGAETILLQQGEEAAFRYTKTLEGWSEGQIQAAINTQRFNTELTAQQEKLQGLFGTDKVDVPKPEDYVPLPENSADAWDQYWVDIGKSQVDGLATMAANQEGGLGVMARTWQTYQLIEAQIAQGGAIAKAWASAPFPSNMGAVALATAQTGLQIAQIQGAFDNGGTLRAGQAGIVSEWGKEEVSRRGNGGGTMVVNNSSESLNIKGRKATAGGGGGGDVINVTFPISSPDAAGVKKLLIENKDTIYKAVQAASRDRGKPM